jgi:hypothetical protein
VGLAAYSAPSSGYLTAWPPVDLGRDLVPALHRAGITAAELPTSLAWGWAAVPLGADDKPIGGAVRIMAPDADANGARVVAYGMLARGPVALCKAVAHTGPITVWQRVERLDVAQAVPVGACRLGPGGALVGLGKAAAGPKYGVDVAAFAKKLASGLHTPQVSEAGLAAVKSALDGLDLNWNKASRGDIDKAFAHARESLGKVAAATGGQLLPEWTQKIRVSLMDTAAASRKWTHDHYLPRVGLSLRQPDQLAITQVSQQQGWFLRDEMGKRSDKLTAEGRKIVDVGIREGWGRDDIARALQTKLPNLWGAYGFNYARTVAAVSVTRARAFGEVSGYQDAGIESLEIVAMLDERTTDQCRCLDGQIIPVGGAYKHAVEAASVAKPEDIYKVAPFLQAKWDKNAEATQITTRQGAQIATVSRSGVGVADDRGEFKMQSAGPGLLTNGIGMPPYHFQCRTTTVPRLTSSQVSKGEIPVAAPVPVQPPTPAPPAMSMPMLEGLGFGGAAAPTALPAQRPIMGMAEPSVAAPASVPSLSAVDTGPVVNPTPPIGPGGSGELLQFRQVLDQAKANLEAMYDAEFMTMTPASVQLYSTEQFGPAMAIKVEAKISVKQADALGWEKTTKTLGWGKAMPKAEIDAMVANMEAEGWTYKSAGPGNGVLWKPPPKLPPPSPMPAASPMQGAGVGPQLKPTPAASDFARTLEKEYAEYLDEAITVEKFSVGIKDLGPNQSYWFKAWGKGLKPEGQEFYIKSNAEDDRIFAEAVQNTGKLGPPYVPPPAVAPPGVKPAKSVGLPETPIIDNVLLSAVQDLEAQIGAGKFKIAGMKLPVPGQAPYPEVLYTKAGSSITHYYVAEVPAVAMAQIKIEAKKLKLGKGGGWATPAEKVPPQYQSKELTNEQAVWKAQAEAEAAKKATRAKAAGKTPEPPPDLTPDHIGPIRAVRPGEVINPTGDYHVGQATARNWEAQIMDAGEEVATFVNKQHLGTRRGLDYAGQPEIWRNVGDKADAVVMKAAKLNPAQWAQLKEEKKLAYRYNFGADLKSSWNGNSMDHKTDMHAMHLAAREEFGLADAMTASMRKPVLEQVYKEYTPEELHALRAYLRGMYNTTQAQLAKMGIKTVKLYRGMSIEKTWEQPEGIMFGAKPTFQVGNVALQPVSSFSMNPSTAHGFAYGHDHGMLIHIEVEASRVIGIGAGGLGTVYESEFCVLGGKGQASGVFWDHTQAKWAANEDKVFQEFVRGSSARTAAGTKGKAKK